MKKFLLIIASLLILSACILPIPFAQQEKGTPTPSPPPATSTPTVTPTPSYQARVEGLRDVKDGDSFSQTTAYQHDIFNPHPLVILHYLGEYHEWNQNLPEDWQPNTFEDIELVVIIRDDVEVPLDTQSYLPGPSITRYRHDLGVEVFETHSGEEIAEGTVQGPEPEPFPETAPMEQTRIDGELANLSRLTTWLAKEIYSQTMGQAEGYVNNVDISPDGDTIASGFSNGDIYIYGLKDQSLMTTFQTSGSVIDITYSPDSTTLASIIGGQDDIFLWNVTDGTLSSTLSGLASPRHIIFSPNGEMLACSSGKDIYVWSLENRNISTVISGHTDGISSIAFSPDGELIASVSHDETLRVWQTDTGTLIVTTEIPQVPYNAFSDVIFSQNGDNIIASLWDTYLVINTDDGSVNNSFVFDNPHNKEGLALSPDGSIWASVSTDELLQLWNMVDFSLLTTLDDQIDFWMTSVDFSSDGKIIAAQSGEDTFRVWNLESILDD